MNFDPNIPNLVAISMGLLAAAMWGSWFIVLKHLDDYPLEAFYLTLFVVSMVIVWSAGLLLDGPELWGNIQTVWRSDPMRITITFFCGIFYVIGIQLSLYVMQVLGLAVTQPVQASINVVGGTALSAVIGGIPVGLSVGRILTSVGFLLAAVVLSMIAGRIRHQSQKAANIVTGLSDKPQEIKKAILLLLISSFLIPAYTIALSYGLKSTTQVQGLAPLPFMAVLCSGAFMGALIVSGSMLTARRQWGVFRKYGFRTHSLGIIAGFAHYGGNIIHTYATRNLSSVVSWPLGFTAGLWTSMWGLVYGEFKGSPTRAYSFLVGGMVCYLIGALLITMLV
jgi:glucose uptake protein GlcU